MEECIAPYLRSIAPIRRLRRERLRTDASAKRTGRTPAMIHVGKYPHEPQLVDSHFPSLLGHTYLT
jgi:hypothetical protein